MHEAIGPGIEADFNRDGTGIYSDLLDKRIAPDFVTIVDDGALPNKRGGVPPDSAQVLR